MNIFEQIAKLIAEGKTDEANALFAKHLDDTNKGLVDKKDELLDSLRKQKDQNSDFKTRLDAIEAEKQAAEDKALEKTGDVEKIKASLIEKYEAQIADLKVAHGEEVGKLTGQLTTHVVDGGLSAALAKAGVKPDLMDAATALIKAKYGGELGDNDGSPFAKFDGKAVNDFVTDWAKDGGKPFILAKNNSGGGSQGANDGSNADGAKTITRTEFDAMSQGERMEASKSGTKVVNET